MHSGTTLFVQPFMLSTIRLKSVGSETSKMEHRAHPVSCLDGSSYAETWEFPGERMICRSFFSLNERGSKSLTLKPGC